MEASLYQLLQQGATLLTASRHLAHALLFDYAQVAQGQGRQVWPTPRILPWSTYLRAACQQLRNGLTEAPRLLSDAQSLALWERVVAESEVGQALLNPGQAARNAQRSWQRLHQYLIPLAKVAAYPDNEAQAFYVWAQQFKHLTSQRNWLDAARFGEFLSAHQFKPDTDLLVYGFDIVPPAMQRLLTQWQALGVAVHDPAADDRVGLVQAGSVQVIAAKDAQAELRQAANWARQQVERGIKRIAVVVPQLTQRHAAAQRCFLEVFAPKQRRIDVEQEPSAFRVVATPPLAQYPLVHHALSLLQLLPGRADVLLVGQLLRSPFFAGYEQEASLRAVADIKARELRQQVWTGNDVERLAATSNCPQFAALLHATQRYWRDLSSKALPSEWTERFMQLLRLSGWPHGRSLNSEEQQTYTKLQQLLAELSAMDELLGRIEFSTALTTLRDACHAASFAPESLDQAVTLIDVDSISGMQFDALWVMGLHAGDWPPAPEPDPFLPIELQRQYVVPEANARTCLQLAQRKLKRLVQTARTVILSWPEHDGDAELRVSPLLMAWQTQATELENRAPLGAYSWGMQLFTARPTLEVFQDEVAPSLTPGAAKGGSRIVELQSRCPFKAQAELRLFAQPLPSVSPAVEPTERGQLVHSVLKEVWQHLKDSDGLRSWLDAQGQLLPELQTEIRRVATHAAQQVLPGSTVPQQRLAALEVELCVQGVLRLLVLESTRTPFTVQRSEQAEYFELAGMTIKIQLDRVDELADGSKLLIDYKTGASNKPRQWLDVTPGRPNNPQLPLYAIAHREHLAGIAFAVLTPGQAEFRGLANTADIAPGIDDYAQLKPNRQLPGIADWPALLTHWQSVLAELAQQYLSGAAQVDPLPGECDYCHLRSLCRIHEQGASVAEEGDDE